jgi:hypothetical protein
VLRSGVFLLIRGIKIELEAVVSVIIAEIEKEYKNFYYRVDAEILRVISSASTNQRQTARNASL